MLVSSSTSFISERPRYPFSQKKNPLSECEQRRPPPLPPPFSVHQACRCPDERKMGAFPDGALGKVRADGSIRRRNNAAATVPRDWPNTSKPFLGVPVVPAM